jgi:hypothetical protein
VRRQPSQTQTSVRLATQAPNSATDSAMGRCSQEVWRLVRLMAKTSGDSSLRVSTNIFFGIQDSFTTQDSKPNATNPPWTAAIPALAGYPKRRPAKPETPAPIGLKSYGAWKPCSAPCVEVV